MVGALPKGQAPREGNAHEKVAEVEDQGGKDYCQRRCAACKEPVFVEERMRGKKGKCPLCDASIKIPTLEAGTAAPKTDSKESSRRERQEEQGAGPRPQPFIFNFKPETEAFRLRIQFRKSNVSRQELIATLHSILESLETEESNEGKAAAAGDHAVA